MGITYINKRRKYTYSTVFRTGKIVGLLSNGAVNVAICTESVCIQPTQAGVSHTGYSNSSVSYTKHWLCSHTHLQYISYAPCVLNGMVEVLGITAHDDSMQSSCVAKEIRISRGGRGTGQRLLCEEEVCLNRAQQESISQEEGEGEASWNGWVSLSHLCCSLVMEHGQ